MAVSEAQIERAIALSKAYGVSRLILFGSAAESPETAQDLDLACDGIAGWRIFELGAQIEDELGTSVDLIPLRPSTPFTRIVERKGKVLI
ncbi:MAG: DNA polymerase III subunit beta [Thermodesulfobacteriota bacterium]